MTYASAFTSICPNGKADDAYAHDIGDSFASEYEPRFLFCKRCGQAARLTEAIEATHMSVNGDRQAGAS